MNRSVRSVFQDSHDRCLFFFLCNDELVTLHKTFAKTHLYDVSIFEFAFDHACHSFGCEAFNLHAHAILEADLSFLLRSTKGLQCNLCLAFCIIAMRCAENSLAHQFKFIELEHVQIKQGQLAESQTYKTDVLL